MSLNAYPGRAFIERVTNEGDANLEAKALSHDGTMPVSPTEAAAKWFGLDSTALSTGLADGELRKIAQRTVAKSSSETTGSDMSDQNRAVRQQDSSKIPGQPGNKSGPAVRPPSGAK
jgi:hypothetical protein